MVHALALDTRTWPRGNVPGLGLIDEDVDRIPAARVPSLDQDGARARDLVGEYERVRAEGTHFLLAPGHEDGSHERVLRRRGSYQVVEKVKPRVAAIVRRLDPRRT